LLRVTHRKCIDFYGLLQSSMGTMASQDNGSMVISASATPVFVPNPPSAERTAAHTARGDSVERGARVPYNGTFHITVKDALNG
jgi:hypothetical protein